LISANTVASNTTSSGAGDSVDNWHDEVTMQEMHNSKPDRETEVRTAESEIIVVELG
jgi:hypothetical protein